MKHFAYIILLILIGCKQPKLEAEFRLTDPKNGILFEKQPPVMFSKSTSGNSGITVDGNLTYQEMDGYGFTLSQGSAIHLLGMKPEARKEILTELFGKDENSIGVSYLRLSVAASDLNEYPFSYHDVEEGEKDTLLLKFDLGPDRKDVIPILKEIMAINPEITLMASPWSPPAWMKDNKDTRGGKLLPEFYDRYALYLVKYIQQMAVEGFTIDALTIQNEPLHPGNNPSLLMLAEEQRDFVKYHLGPKFEANQIKTKIIIYDHNADRPDYPISILDDPEAKKYIDGSAFHLYGGKIEALSEVHKAHPDKNLYFTEQWVGAPGNLAGDLAWHTKYLTIGAPRNWAKTVLEWNLSSAPDLKPHTDRGGCDQCLGAITIKIDNILRNPAYYVIAHASKYILPGSIRIDSNEPEGLPNVAFKRPDGKIVVLILNESKESKSFAVNHKEWSGEVMLEAGAVATILL